jgi:hypothetical protein
MHHTCRQATTVVSKLEAGARKKRKNLSTRSLTHASILRYYCTPIHTPYPILLLLQLSGGFINLDMVKSTPRTQERRTKIICTIGPASWSAENLGKLMDAGMNTARLNFSHGDHEGHGAVLDRLRAAATAKSRNISGKCTYSYRMDSVRSDQVRAGCCYRYQLLQVEYANFGIVVVCSRYSSRATNIVHRSSFTLRSPP